MRDRWAWCGLVGLGCAGLACDGAGGAAGPVGRLSVDVAALQLPGVGDVVWDVEVVNGRTPVPDVVWRRRISSSGYGDGAGSASYLGPCDAEPAVASNTVRVWVVGVYAAPVTALGGFASGDPAEVAGERLAFENPTTGAAPLTQTVACAADADAAVRFDVALMRPATQGFFDIAVSFNDVYCSAKFDCCVDDDGAPGCDEDLRLLFDASGARARTLVLGFACTSGPAAAGETELLFQPVELDCSDPGGAVFAADLRVDPSAGSGGNLCAAGAVGSCAPAVTEAVGVDADTYLYQVAVYRGVESLASGGVPARKVYWNLALGATPALAGCRLRTAATADDTAGAADGVTLGTISAGAVYPYVAWDVDLGSCVSEALTFGVPGAAVAARYTGTADGPTAFAYRFGPTGGASAFCGAGCLHGGVCRFGACDCGGTGYGGATCATAVCATPCQNGGVCSAPNTCACAPGFSGASCETSSFVGTVYFLSGRATVRNEPHVYTMNLDGSAVALVSSGAECKSFSTFSVSPSKTQIAALHDPDGNCVYVTDTPWPAYIMNTNGTGLRTLSSSGSYLYLRPPFRWSPDSTRVATVYSTDGMMPGYNNIAVVNAATGATQILTSNSGTYKSNSPSWSPDGTKIAYADNTAVGGGYEIWVMNADGSGKVNLTSNAASDTVPMWSPDGSRIAFLSTRSGNTDVFAMAPDGTGVVNLTQSAASEGTYFEWSPSGARLLFSRSSRLWVMNADGGGQLQLEATLYLFSAPTWTPAGTHAVFASSGEIYRVAVDGSGLTNLTQHASEDSAPTF